MSVWMITGPKWTKRIIEAAIEKFDCHKWTLAKEKGASGYEHIQGRIRISDSNDGELFSMLSGYGIHVEKSDRFDDTYERKDGRYWTSDDTVDVRKQRFGSYRESQDRVLRCLEGTNDRQVVLWYDTEGNAGKSWFIGNLWERGLAYTTSECGSAKGMIQDIASDYLEHGYRPYVVIDLPRTARWTQELYLAIERIKDGLIKDPRYGSRTINIRGVKVLVCSNTKPKFDRLSADRWVVLGEDGASLL